VDSSSYVAYYFYKFAALMFVFLALASVHSLAFPEQSIMSSAPVDPTTGEVLLLIGLSIGLIFLAKFMFFRIRVIRYDAENIEIINGSDTERVTWGDVKSVSKVIGVVPPLYRMVFKVEREPAYFVMSMFLYAYAIIWSWDFTGFYSFAQERIERNELKESG
jgi:ABC-type Fe3+-siderophore transport system permease subunit